MAFKETDKTVFIGRRQDGTIYGHWSIRQWPGQEEVLESDLELKSFIDRPKRNPGDPKPTSPIIDPRLNKG